MDAGGGADEMVFVNAWLRYRKLVIRGSAETLPTCRRVLNRFAAIFKVWMCVRACVRACVFVSVWFPLVMEAI